MSDLDLIGFANEAFYRAFSALDSALMADVWARETETRCLHPGAHPLRGRDRILASWTEIFANSEAGSISFQVQDMALVNGIGIVCCFEEVNGHFGVATNLFAREGTLWRMIHHQAGPISTPPRQRTATVKLRPN
ncbi:MAG: nuclear transport factor 2 family protein [Dongiaceae bacterium]